MYHVGDFILRIKNAYNARRKQVVMPYSNINNAISGLLVKEGFLAKSEIGEDNGHKAIVATLRYENRKPALHEVAIVSKPSLRVYVDSAKMAKDRDWSKTSVLSTSSGIMTGAQAKKKGVGGELLFKIW